MKKILSIAIAFVMMLSICIPAFAADLTTMPGQASDVEISTSTLKDTDGDGIPDAEAESYIVTIPADTVIPWGAAETDVSYSVEAHLTRNNRVNVTVAGNGAMTTADGAYSLAYTLDGSVDYTTAEANVYPAAVAELKVLVAEDAWNTAIVEEYSDILTYTSEIVTA